MAIAVGGAVPQHAGHIEGRDAVAAVPGESHAMPHLSAQSRRVPAWRPLAVAIALLLPSAAFAQDPAEPAPPAPDAVRQAATLDTVEVTAQRRVENVQDVPVSISTVDTEQLGVLASGGADIRFLSGRVPSLNIESSYGRAFPRFYIRGLGNTDFDLNASQPVSLVY